MAQINNTLNLTDRMSPVLRTVLDTLELTMRTLEQVDKSTKNVKTGISNMASSFVKSFKNIDKSWAAFTTGLNSALSIVDRLVDGFSDLMTSVDSSRSTVARIGLYNTSDISNDDYYRAIYRTALNTRSDLEDTADLVNKLLVSGVFTGESNVASSIHTASIINKALIAGGGIAEDNKRALRQLTQALGSGVLQGDELRSIREQAQYLAETLAKGLALVDDKFEGIGIADLKELGSQGELTADRVVRAFLAMEDMIDENFEQMPRTFSQGMESLETIWKMFLWQLSLAEGPLDRLTDMVWDIVDFLNSAEGAEFLNDVGSALSVIVDLCGYALTGVRKFITFLQDNLPVATGLFYGLGVAATAAALKSLWAWLKLAWPILLIATLVGVIAYKFIEAGYSASETAGIILGSILAVVAVLWDIILWIIDAVVAVGAAVITVVWVIISVISTVIDFIFMVIASAVELVLAGIGKVISDALSKWYSFADTVLTGLTKLASAIDSVFGTNLAGGLSDIHTWLTSKYETVMDIVDPADRISEIGDLWEGFIDRTSNKFGVVGDIWEAFGDFDSMISDLSWNPEDAYNTGYNAGSSALNWISEHSPGNLGSASADDYERLLESLGVNVAGGNLDSVGSIKNDVNLNDEDIQLLRDMAARDYLLNLQQVTPVAHISFGDVRETADVNKIMDVIEDMVEEQMATALVAN